MKFAICQLGLKVLKRGLRKWRKNLRRDLLYEVTSKRPKDQPRPKRQRTRFKRTTMLPTTTPSTRFLTTTTFEPDFDNFPPTLETFHENLFGKVQRPKRPFSKTKRTTTSTTTSTSPTTSTPWLSVLGLEMPNIFANQNLKEESEENDVFQDDYDYSFPRRFQSPFHMPHNHPYHDFHHSYSDPYSYHHHETDYHYKKPPMGKTVVEVDFTPIFLALLPLFLTLGTLLGLQLQGTSSSSVASTPNITVTVDNASSGSDASTTGNTTQIVPIYIYTNGTYAFPFVSTTGLLGLTGLSLGFGSILSLFPGFGFFG